MVIQDDAACLLKVQATPQSMPKKLDLTTLAKQPLLSGSSNCQHLSKASTMLRMLVDHQELRFSLEQSNLRKFECVSGSSFPRCSYMQLEYIIDIIYIYKLYYKSRHIRARNVFLSLSAQV